MQMALDFVTSPWVGVLVLAVLVLEAIALNAYYRATGRGVPLSELLPFLGAGAAFAVALAASLSMSSGSVGTTLQQAASVGLPLIVAFVFHLWDLKRRWTS